MMKIKTKTKGRILSLLTALAMTAALFPTIPVLADGTEYGAFTVTTDVTDGCSYSSPTLTISKGGTYTISQTSGTDTATSDTIAITATDGDVTINLAGVNIESGSTSPFLIDSNSTANVTVVLSNTNTLTATGGNYAGLQKGTGSDYSLTITSAEGDGETSGSLTVTGNQYGAGIGGGSYGSGSNITINGGTVTATAGNGAGIGGGRGGAGSNITINGGTVTATASAGAGIGGGRSSAGTVTIKAGYITAYSTSGSAIGTGYSGDSSSVTITGGYFADSYTTGQQTVYGITPASGYAVFANTDGSTKSAYPCYVGEYTSEFWVSTENSDGYTYADNLLNITESGEYTVSMVTSGATATSDTIKVTATDGDVTVTLSGVSVANSSTSPLEIDCGETENTVTVKLDGENTLTSTASNYAGLQKTSTANTLIITTANDTTADKLTATGGSNGAGIGGGYSGAGSNITITNSTVTATSTQQ
ncbi:MAG: carbohydrate-binding domain-containing protein, partial [Firmicutes bacterium]|nr:carbohydrate-binding domain-containing protein [Bacillota bacterium]